MWLDVAGLKVQHTARLHEETVQKVAQGRPAFDFRGRPLQRRHATKWSLTVHPLVMAEARRVRRPGTTIRIINEGTVLIINKEK